MKLTMCLARSYRPFNYDFKRKLNTSETNFPACKDPWDQEDDFEAWRPMVQAPVRAPISCVVGLNESGKSFLIEAIWKVMTNASFEWEDVCRYSRECRIERMGTPKVGVIWDALSDDLIAALNGLSPFSNDPITSSAGLSLVVMREATDTVRLITLSPASVAVHDAILTIKDFSSLLTYFPRFVRISSRAFLPATVPLKAMMKIALSGLDDNHITAFLTACKDKKLFSHVHEVRQYAVDESQRLAFNLLRHCAGVDHNSLYQISIASDQLRKEFSAQASDRAEELLNLGHWWGQDVDAKISLDLRSDEVLLNVTDRTGSWYGFAERSQGMRYFLGYILQILLEFKTDARPLMILTDEPDFALSSVGQRDLLRFFKEIVTWQHSGAASQILFSTHSPELIDPNYPQRITVLRKGSFDEGTTTMSRSHHRLFEPVRSALGARVSSLPFIDGPNLVVEGLSDRTFILRMSQHLASRGLLHLDLASLSIVVAEGSHRVGGITLTAKSIAGDRAYITILLDNDEPGRTAAAIARAQDKYLAEQNQVVMMDDILGPGLGKDSEIEELLPASLYYQAFLDVITAELVSGSQTGYPGVEEIVVQAKTRPIVDVVTTARRAVQGTGGDPSYDKEAVINRVFDIVEAGGAGPVQDVLEETLGKATALLRDRINENMRNKRHDEVSRTMRLLIKDFVHLNPLSASKARSVEMLEHVRELGNRVSPVGVFDKEVDALLVAFALRLGLRSEEVQNHSEFIAKLKQLPQRIAIDPNLSLI